VRVYSRKTYPLPWYREFLGVRGNKDAMVIPLENTGETDAIIDNFSIGFI
jgi:hypothetical protein